MATVWEDSVEQFKRLKGKPFKEKAKYFWEYYRYHTIGAIGIIAFIIVLVVTISTAKDYALSVVMINSVTDSLETPNGIPVREKMISDISERIDFNPKEYEVAIDTSITLGRGETTANAEYASVQKFAAMMSAQNIDIVVCNTSIYEQYAQNAYFYDLRQLYDDQTLAAYNGYIYYTDAATFGDYDDDTDMDVTAKQASYVVDHHDPDSMTDPIPCGFFAGKGTLVDNYGLYSYMVETDIYQGYQQEAVIGIPVNSPRTDNAIAGIEYLMGK